MQIGIIGLGRMGGNMAQRLLRHDHDVVGYDPTPDAVEALNAAGGRGAESAAELVGMLTAPRAVWVMVPAGDITEAAISELAGLLEPRDVVIDGGNSNYRQTMRRAEMLAERDIDMLDCGTSGGVWGLDNGYCLTVGGKRSVYEFCRPIFRTLAPEGSDGNLYVGPSGSGHYVKMVHNGIEYAMMQAYAEGIELLDAHDAFDIDLAAVCENWGRGSVIRSWLLELTADELAADPKLEALSSIVDDSGEGRWTVDASVELAVPAPTIALALQMRFRSRQVNPLGGRALAAMRNAFGGHRVHSSEQSS